MERELRYLANGQNNPLSDIIMRALQISGKWDIEAMRRPGFQNFEVLESQFRAAAPMLDKAQVQIDKAVVEVGLQRLTVTADIMASGLTYNLADPLSVAQLEWNTISKTGAAQRTMTPSSRGENKLPQVSPNRLPIYLTTDKFELDIRTLKTSQRSGLPLDTTLVKHCVRSVNEAIEDATINGATTIDGQDLQVAGYKAPGLLNAPNAATKTNLSKAAWIGTTPNGGTIFSEVMAMIALLQANQKYGPYNLYVPTVVGNALDGDYNTTNNAQGLTTRQRLLQISSLSKISVADLLPAGAADGTGAKVVLVQMTSDVIDIVVGQQPTVVPWTSIDGFTIHNLVMAILIPRVKSDYNSKSGICIGTLA